MPELCVCAHYDTQGGGCRYNTRRVVSIVSSTAIDTHPYGEKKGIDLCRAHWSHWSAETSTLTIMSELSLLPVYKYGIMCRWADFSSRACPKRVMCFIPREQRQMKAKPSRAKCTERRERNGDRVKKWDSGVFIKAFILVLCHATQGQRIYRALFIIVRALCVPSSVYALRAEWSGVHNEVHSFSFYCFSSIQSPWTEGTTARLHLFFIWHVWDCCNIGTWIKKQNETKQNNSNRSASIPRLPFILVLSIFFISFCW